MHSGAKREILGGGLVSLQSTDGGSRVAVLRFPTMTRRRPIDQTLEAKVWRTRFRIAMFLAEWEPMLWLARRIDPMDY